jgi:putative methyltransferase (TIGR04325 family)
MLFRQIVTTLIALLKARVRPDLEYAPDGWNTPLPSSRASGWNSGGVVSSEVSKWEAYIDNLRGAGPLGFSHEHGDLSVVRNVSFHNIHVSYAYVLALAAHKKDVLRVLDWGGGLGHYYLLGKAVLPDVKLEFHCKEMQGIADSGRKLNPEVHWHTEEDCLSRTYDLVMINGSLQYMPDWKDMVRKIAASVDAGGYLFLTRLPVVESSGSFVAVQRAYGTRMLHGQFNEEEVLGILEGASLVLLREFVVGDRPRIKGAPEQCELRGYLFRQTRGQKG